MPSLQAYLDFTVLLDFSTDKVAVTVPNNFPSGVAAGITGIISVKQPDGVKKSGTFSSPDIYWKDSSLAVGYKTLRRTTQGLAQKGEYIVSVTLRHPDYDEAILTKKFTSTYEQSTGKIEREFDVFTPSLFLDDETIYNSPDFVVDTDYFSREWNITLGSVGNLVSTEKRVDLMYAGKYYDAKYIVNLAVHATYLSTNGQYGFLSIKDYFDFGSIEYANTPLPYNELLGALNEIKEADDAACNQVSDGCGCAEEGGYGRALELFQHIKERICGFDTIELYSYLEEFLSIYGKVSSDYENTNEQILPYDRSFCANEPGGGDDDNPSTPPDIEFVVGVTPGFPVGGESSYTNPALAGWEIRMLIGKIQQSQIDDLSGVYFSKPRASSTITLIGQTFVSESLVQIQFVAGKKNYSSDGGSNQVQTNWADTNPASPAYLKNKPTSFPPAPHSHSIGDVTGLQGALNLKADIGHSHSIGDVTGLQGALNLKADQSATYTKTQVDNLISGVSNANATFLNGTVEIDSTTTITAGNLNSLHQIRAGATSIVITLPDVTGLGSGVAAIESLYDNTAQHKLQAQPGQNIFYNGIFKNYLWIGTGEYMWLFYGPTGWFLINSNVNWDLIGQPQFVFTVGRNQVVLDGSTPNRTNIMPRLFERAQTFGDSYIADSLWSTASVEVNGITIPRPYRGCYSNGNNLTTFRLPDMKNMGIRGLSSYTGAVDAARYYNHSGGYQLNDNKEHFHFGWVDIEGGNGNSFPEENGKGLSNNNSPTKWYLKGGGGGGESYKIWGETNTPTIGKSSKSGGSEARMDNIGGIWVTNY